MVVSKEFIEIYRNFNVTDQIDKLKSLSKSDLYLMLILCLDRYNEDDNVVLNNFKGFEMECKVIFDLQDDKDVSDVDLNFLKKETKNEYIDTEILTDENGEKLPIPYTLQEVRDIKLKLLSE